MCLPGEPGDGSQPSDQAQQCASSCLLLQYTHKLQQELQNFKLDVKGLDLLSPAARRDLEALQGSGLEKIHFRDFFVQVGEGQAHLLPQQDVALNRRARLCVFCFFPAAHSLSTPGTSSC